VSTSYRSDLGRLLRFLLLKECAHVALLETTVAA
jgi:hypothetical protein